MGDCATVTINPYSEVAAYRQLAQIVEDRIKRGELRHLDKLPSEKALEQTYGVGRDTVRSALALLRERGTVFTVAGRGTFVGPRPSP
jgi:GntR family transcriptional regulator